MLPDLTNSYRVLPPLLFSQADPDHVAEPRLVALNESLAEELGIQDKDLDRGEMLAYLSGIKRWPGSEPIALAYAGHQFGGFSPQLGDGRAHLLGELRGKDGVLYDLQLKGSGRTPYSRGGDGKAALGPVLREYLVSEAMFVLGVPTTRALAAVRTGEPVHREGILPGAVLTRVAKSHLRVGTFEFLAARNEDAALVQLVDYALDRLYPDADERLNPALRLLDAVIDAQAALIPKWMGLGFIHGVMNTDNCAISGQTIDYGPCAFMDSFDPDRRFSSIDRGGRYAYSKQAGIAQWNLARLAESLLSIIDSNEERAVDQARDRLHQFPSRYEHYFGQMCAKKLGLGQDHELAALLLTELFTLMRAARSDFTLTFRRLYEFCEGAEQAPFLKILGDSQEALEWTARFKRSFDNETTARELRLSTMNKANPRFIPRNHRVEEAIAAALDDDETPFFRLLNVLKDPWSVGSEASDLAEPPGEEQWSYKTFCGT